MIEDKRNQNIIIYHHPNPEIKSFLISEEISAPRVEHFKKPLQKGSEEISELVGIFGAQIVKEIMLIPGVMEVRIKPKEIMVKKEESSSWEEIAGRVFEIINRAIKRKNITLVKR